MAILVCKSLKDNLKQLYCAVRRRWVAATAEELVRQATLSKLINLGYPKGLFAVEVALHQMPHLQSQISIRRRVDIICYMPEKMYPLLLVECKASTLRESDLRQVTGYNRYVQAPFVALANSQQERFARRKEKGAYHFFLQIPPFASLFSGSS